MLKSRSWNSGLQIFVIYKKYFYTSMHSSRMRTARLLPVSPSMHCGGGCLLWGCLLWGCLLPGGMSAPRGCLLPGGCLLLWGVCSRGSASGWGVYPSMQWGRHLLPVDRILDTRFWKYYLAPTSLRAVKINKTRSVRMRTTCIILFYHFRISSLIIQNSLSLSSRE